MTMHTLKKTMAMASLLAVAAASAGNDATETVSEPSAKHNGSRSSKRNGNRNSSLDGDAPDHADDMMLSVEDASDDSINTSTSSVSISSIASEIPKSLFRHSQTHILTRQRQRRMADEPTLRFFPDWSNLDTCILDNDNDQAPGGSNDNYNAAPPYMRLDPNEWMEVSLSDCCNRYYSWNYYDCVSGSIVEAYDATIQEKQQPQLRNDTTKKKKKGRNIKNKKQQQGEEKIILQNANTYMGTPSQAYDFASSKSSGSSSSVEREQPMHATMKQLASTTQTLSTNDKNDIVQQQEQPPKHTQKLPNTQNQPRPGYSTSAITSSTIDTNVDSIAVERKEPPKHTQKVPNRQHQPRPTSSRLRGGNW